MSFLLEQCEFFRFTKEMKDVYGIFDCGDEDLNEFFSQDAFLQQNELLCKNYCFVTETEGEKRIIAAFTLSNDSIKKIPNSRKKKIEKSIDRSKHYFSYPSVMIGRIGVSVDMQGNHIGEELLNFIKAWFLDPLNKTGCRFLLVDSYKTDRNLHFYEKNGFDYLFSSEQQEKEFRNISIDKELKTRLMFFDLKLLCQ